MASQNPAAARARRAAVRPQEGPLTLEGLTEAWPAILATVGEQRRVVREALGHAVPASVAGSDVTLEVSDSEVHLEGLERSRALVAEAIATVMGQPVRISYRPASGSGEAEPPANSARLDREADREERLRQYRSTDPALDAVAEALDLELLE